MRQREIEEKRREEENVLWFNQARPMVRVKPTWREKRLTKEQVKSSGSSSEDDQNVQGEDKEPSKEVETRDLTDTVAMDVSMIHHT
jgi:hypothetical protein